MIAIPAIANVSKVSFVWTSPDLRINWTGKGDSYDVRYRDQVADEWTGPVNTTDSAGITIGGLVEGTHYDFEIVTNKGSAETASPQAAPTGGSTLPAYYGYLIPQGLTKPTNCAIVDQSATQVTISWSGDDSKQHRIRWTDNTGYTQYMTVTGLTATIQDLDMDRSYKIYIGVTQGPETVWGDCYLDKN